VYCVTFLLPSGPKSRCVSEREFNMTSDTSARARHESTYCTTIRRTKCGVVLYCDIGTDNVVGRRFVVFKRALCPHSVMAPTGKGVHAPIPSGKRSSFICHGRHCPSSSVTIGAVSRCRVPGEDGSSGARECYERSGFQILTTHVDSTKLCKDTISTTSLTHEDTTRILPCA
jgi:hypothetical protein